MPRSLIKPRAQIDLLEIWAYIASDNPDKADAHNDMLREKFALLARTPMMGRERGELGRSIRSFPVGNYFVFYQPLKDGIEIIRVLHSSRDITSLDI